MCITYQQTIGIPNYSNIFRKPRPTRKGNIQFKLLLYHRTSQDTGHQSSKEKPLREGWAGTAARKEDIGPCLTPVHSLTGLTGWGWGPCSSSVPLKLLKGNKVLLARLGVDLQGGNLEGKEAVSELGQMRQDPWCSQ